MTRLALIIAAILVGSCAVPPPAGNPGVSELTGRTAGVPQRCISIERYDGLRVIGPHTLAYGRGRTIWVNAVPECAALSYSDVLITNPVATKLCRGDLVRSIDAASRIPKETCRLGDFVSYTLG